MISQQFRSNRARFSHEELIKYRGGWVAFSADGCHILVGGETIDQVEEWLAAQGQDAQHVVLEWVPGAEDDSLLGGSELAP